MKALIRFSLIILVSMAGSLHARTIEAHNPQEVFAAIPQLRAGDTLLIHPGTYALNQPLVLNGDYSLDDLVVIANNTIWTGSDIPFLLDLRGECINWQGGDFSGGKVSVIEIRGNNIRFGHAQVHGDHGETMVDKGIGLIGKNNTIHHCEIYHFGNIGIEGNGGEIGPNKEIQRLDSDNPYRSVQNWHIYGNHIHHIRVKHFGIHEGAMKLVPMVRGVYIYDNLIEHCEGQGIWLDRPEGDVLIYGNVIRHIEGKGIFYEISDDFPGTFGLYVLKNHLSHTGRQPIWISGSNNATVLGNYAHGSLPSGAGNMPREIAKVNGVAGTGRHMTLKNNRFEYNVFVPTGSRNHLAIYDYRTQTDPNADNNRLGHNYYATGHEATLNDREVEISEPGFRFDTSKSIGRSSTESGLAADPDGETGPDPKGFVYSDEESGVIDLLRKFPAVMESLQTSPGYLEQ